MAAIPPAPSPIFGRLSDSMVTLGTPIGAMHWRYVFRTKTPLGLMSDFSPKDFVDALTDSIREQLVEGTSVDFPGLGTFSVEHRPSTPPSSPASETRRPPRSVVTFTPTDAAPSHE